MKILRIHFNTVESTNTWAKEHAHELDQEAVTLITASEQTGGRGRFKRKWVSPPNLNIYATFVFFAERDRSDIGHVPQLLALSASYCLEKIGFKPSIKWPNDVLLSRKKVVGILCETTQIENKLAVVCGIGLNVNMPYEELIKIDRPATSLKVESNQIFEVEDILKDLQSEFILALQHFIPFGFSSFFEDYQQRSYFKKNDPVTFHDNQKIINGFFYALNSNGSITLKMENGDLKTFYSGEFIPETI